MSRSSRHRAQQKGFQAAGKPRQRAAARSVESGALVVRPRIEDLVEGLEPMQEIDWGDPVGKETI